MGATWFWNQHRNLLELVHEFNIPYFKQHTQGISLLKPCRLYHRKIEISEAEEPSFRIERNQSTNRNSS
jgi:monoamine oxidase